MKSKVFNWIRSTKTPGLMEKEINDFINDKVFKYAVQNESSKNGRVMLTVFYDKASDKNKANCAATVLRTQGHTALEEQLNEVLSTVKGSMIMTTQTFSNNTISTILFHGK